MQLLELTRHELDIAIRTRRILIVTALYLAASLLGGLLLVWGYSQVEERLIAELQERGNVSADEVRALISLEGNAALRELLENLEIDIDGLAEPLTSSIAAPVFFWCSLAFLPFLIVLTTFDTLSSDLHARSLCFTTLRAARSRTVIAKVLSQIIIFSAVTAIASAALFAAAAWRLDSLAQNDAVRSWIYSVTILIPYGAAYVAITTFCSSTTPRTMIALVRSIGLLFLLRLLSLTDALIDQDAGPLAPLRFLRHLSPAWYHDGMWQAPGLALATSCAAYACFCLLFVALAVRVLDRRDL